MLQIPHCNTMQRPANFYSALHFLAVCCSLFRALQCVAAWCIQHTATNCNKLQLTFWRAADTTLQRTATHRNALHRTATPCNTLQSTATHCNTLQYTVTYCNTHSDMLHVTGRPKGCIFLLLHSSSANMSSPQRNARAHTHTHTHTHTQLCTQAHTRTHTHTETNTYTHQTRTPHTCTRIHTETQTHSLSYTHTHIHPTHFSL